MDYHSDHFTGTRIKNQGEIIMAAIIDREIFDIVFRTLYPHMPNDQFMAMTGLTVHNLKYHSDRLGVKKTAAAKAYYSRTDWTADREGFIRDNFFIMTNAQLAKAVGVTLTVLRNKTREMGLKRNEVENWKPAAIAFLVANYKQMGDVEIMENLRRLWPRKIGWNRGHIHKKRGLLKLFRSDEEKLAIIKKHVSPGGRSFTILRNSALVNMPDTYIASLIAWRNKDLQKEVLKYPEIIDIKRKEVILSRAIKEVQHAQN